MGGRVDRLHISLFGADKAVAMKRLTEVKAWLKTLECELAPTVACGT